MKSKNQSTNKLNCRKHIANVVGADASVCPKNYRGITLIALVITIIVMLILVGVTVSIAINGGLFGTAKQAVKQTKVAEDREQLQGAVMSAYNIQNEILDYAKLAEILSDWEIDESTRMCTSPNGNIFKVYKNGEISINGEENANVSEYIKVGDYVNYSVQSKPEKCLVEAKYSGYTEDQEINKETLKWKVFNINDDGTINLISELPTNEKIILKGALGYNNGVTLVNNVCNTLYSNKEYGAVARSINLEDIENEMNDDGKETITTKLDLELFKYGDKKMYTGENSYYPNLYAEEDGSGINTETTKTDGIKRSDSPALRENGYNQADENGLTVTQTYYYIGDDQDNVSSYFDDTVVYNMIFPSASYWVASRWVSCRSDELVDFGISNVYNTGIYSRINYYRVLFRSSKAAEVKSGSTGFRPIVTIPADYIDTSTNYSEVGAWNLK